MNRGAPKSVRRRFFVALGHAVHLTWPVLSTILAIQVGLGLLKLALLLRHRLLSGGRLDGSGFLRCARLLRCAKERSGARDASPDK